VRLELVAEHRRHRLEEGSMRSQFKTAFAATMCAAGLAGCATQMNASDAGRIQSIAVTAIAEPHYYYAGRGANEDFNEPMRSQGLHLGSEMADAIAKELQQGGYQASAGSLATAPDAKMEITLGGLLPDQLGPIYARQNEGLEPVFTAKVRLVDSKTGKTLFSQLYEVADPPIKPMDGTVLIVPDKKYAMTEESDFAAHPERAAAGFRSAIQPVAKSVAASLKKPN